MNTTPHDPTPRDEKKYVFDNPRNVKIVIWVLVVICIGLLGADFFVARKVEHPWEAMFGFYAAFGFVACVALVLIAKEMRKFIMRKENYYDD